MSTLLTRMVLPDRLILRSQRYLAPLSRDGLPPEDVLPIELWNHVFEHLPDTNLLVGTAVCRAFNGMCIAIFLARNRISTSSFTSGNISIPPDVLPAVQLSCPAPLLHQLRCAGEILDRHLKLLRAVVSSFREMETLELVFKPWTPSVPPWTEPPDTWTLALCNVLFDMTNRGCGPLVVFCSGHLFTCPPLDILAWRRSYGSQWNRFPYSIRTLALRITRVLRQRRQFLLPSMLFIQSIRIHTILTRSCLGSERGTLIVIHPPSSPQLSLGGTYAYGNPVPIRRLIPVLLALILPHLSSLLLRREDIPPTVLREFLERHPTLVGIHIHIPSSRSADPLIAPPLVLPSLTLISADTALAMLRLLAALGDSPRLAELKFPLCTSPAALRTSRPTFRRIAQIPHRIMLDLGSNMLGDDAAAVTVDPEDASIAQTLQCVRDVKLRCNTVHAVQRALPWLALLPNLTGLCLIFQFLPSPDLQAHQQIVADCRAALPHVPDIMFGH
ncbi:hypothetical protein B0H10DRAFT_197047 [Mycena sp. CBHHK59/15]|nr:hypothetical protein B0H10DRAFT_197047 [Mycena sp. CBHHK59/15]